jgi:SAM-dependent methyltransferase
VTEGFADHFSARAAAYSRYRPDYPPALFGFVAGLAPGRALAWDCATGSGQAAVALAAHFERVVATDASAAQLAHAAPHERGRYHAARAEASGLACASVDVVTVAQAMHWFDLDAFYAEARRVLRPGGALAAWTYGDASLDDDALTAILRRFSEETVGPYWPAERLVVLDGYRSIAFPFAEVAVPAFTLERRWLLPELAGYLRTWSAAARFAAAHDRDPVEIVEAELAARWGDPAAPRVVRWPLAMRAGRVP